MTRYTVNKMQIKHKDPHMIEKFVDAFNNQKIRAFANRSYSGVNDFGNDGARLEIDFNTTQVEITFMTSGYPPLKVYENLHGNFNFEIYAEFIEPSMSCFGKWSSANELPNEQHDWLPQTAKEADELSDTYPLIHHFLRECAIEC